MAEDESVEVNSAPLASHGSDGGGIVQCEVGGLCGGCAWIGTPYADQLAEKRATFASLWREAGLPEDVLADIPGYSAGEAGLRDRIDLAHRRQADGPVLGLFDLERTRIVDVGACPAASPELRDFIGELRADPPPIDKASLRLRVGPNNERGLWIDAANADIKALLDEASWLQRQLAGAFVELGQRRKPLVADASRLRLEKKPELRPWFRTWIGDREALLYMPVGGFSQPSLAANRLLVSRAMALVERAGAARWLELGAGCGNFTLPLAGSGAEVIAAETDRTALDGLARATREQGLESRIRTERLSMDGPSDEARALLAEADAVFADPPRSGLGRFTEAIADLDAPPSAIVYASCHGEALVRDAARLTAMGYQPRSLELVDQFPQTPRAEWLALFTR